MGGTSWTQWIILRSGGREGWIWEELQVGKYGQNTLCAILKELMKIFLNFEKNCCRQTLQYFENVSLGLCITVV